MPESTPPAAVASHESDTTVIAATGNGMKSHDRYDTFLEVSGGGGNHDDLAEVHLRIRSNDGHNQGQSWFPAADVLAAVWSHARPDRDEVDEDVLRDALAVSFCRVIHWIARSVARGPGGSDADLRACDLCRATAAEAVASVRELRPTT